jgi:hypothetical protein
MRGTAVLTDVEQSTSANGHSEDRFVESYSVAVKIIGTSPLLSHRYDVQSVKEKGAAAKNSATKKTDDIESYLYREGKQIGVPAKNIVACLREAARSVPDPRSPRKSARDLVATGIGVEPWIALLGKTTWDYLDEQRVVVQRAAVARVRPAFNTGWTLNFRILVKAPEYVNEQWLHELVERAGRFQGLLDGRNIGYGLFRVVSYKREKLT